MLHMIYGSTKSLKVANMLEISETETILIEMFPNFRSAFC